MLINLYMSLTIVKIAVKSQQIYKHCRQLKKIKEMAHYKKACKQKLNNAKQNIVFVKYIKKKSKQRSLEYINKRLTYFKVLYFTYISILAYSFYSKNTLHLIDMHFLFTNKMTKDKNLHSDF